MMSGLKDIALQLGFSDCRVAQASAPIHGERLADWLASGCHASMAWMQGNEHKRLSPQLVLENVRSVIVLSYDYWTSGGREAAMGSIAQYAHGVDYHKIVEEKLADIAETLAQWGGEQRFYTDTGPVLERDAAVAAGLGWCGKSNLLIRGREGSFCVLGVILTSLELPIDPPFKDRCGLCTRCLDACPTAALSDHHLDARRCLSYWSIEHKGAIPEPFRLLMGHRLYGCDDCLNACPWNHRAQEARDLRFSMQKRLRDTPLRDFLHLTDEDFIELVRHSPIRRIKREGFLRNVCVVLGNTGSREDIPALQMVQHESELLAEHAQWAIEQIESR